ncbi:hypothetical protein [Streptosporangium jomthongense]|uniref:Uncharacterized protein n=1 Tax=Streptosporangium jomthongense TaxID=1193683 RepID=A0ABV8F8D3_9ACTN
MVAHDLHAGLVVSCPTWEDGQPVLILSAHTGQGQVAVRYQDARAHHPAHITSVEPGFELDLIGSCQAGRIR